MLKRLFAAKGMGAPCRPPSFESRESAMPTSGTFKTWYLVHKWTSLVCTVFLLLLCLTGLPLIFGEEIDHLLGDRVDPPDMPGFASSRTPMASLDGMVEAAKARRPDEFIRSVSQPRDMPDAWNVSMGLIPVAMESSARLTFDARTGELLLDRNLQQGVMYVITRLHVDLFTGPAGTLRGLAGMLFLGSMGLSFVVSIVSGAVVYGPYMRKLPFGTVRRERAPRLKWLDLHNLLGIVVVGWALVVGVTGVINTLARPMFSYWQSTELAAMTAPWRGKPAPTTFASLDRAVQAARAAEPTLKVATVVFPGQKNAGNHHFMVFMRGNTPLTLRLIKPVLIDAQTGEFTDKRDMPWYVTALRVSQPLHFGDYGGMPLQILWAVLDLITIVLLGSGLYLWWQKRQTSMELLWAEADPNHNVVLSATQRMAPR
ncbi:MAG: PepSY-associated TM helix domain-containing protein [Nitrospirota bacterium]